MITHKISKGFDVRLAGKAEAQIVDAPDPALVAVQPGDFPGVAAPGIKAKPMVKVGDRVRTGDPVFFDKRDPDSQFLAPVTGTVKDVVLGERRALLRVEIQPDGQEEFADLPRVQMDALGSMAREDLTKAIKQAGLWPLLRQRPVNRSADASRTPAAIFVNGMDTAPLAADPALLVQGRGEDLQVGVDVLKALTDGSVYLTVRPGDQPKELQALHGVEIHAFDGPHPAGLPSTHISSIRPLKADEVAWCLRAQDVARIGAWARTGRYPAEVVVAVAGHAADNRRYYRTRQGVDLATLTGGKSDDESLRVISGDVLNGAPVAAGGHLGYFDSTVTVIPDGEGRRDMFGWLLPQPGKHSASRAVWSWLKPKDEYELDARVHGGPRSIVNIGQWERVVPLDIYPSFLVRAIQANDLEEALSLGLLEVTEEDVALCTFVDPCKIDVGAIIRQGLDLYEAES